MGAHNHYQDGYLEHSRLDTKVADPGSNSTFDLKGRTDGYAIIASGTRVLPNSIPLGVNFRVYATGNVTITSVAAVTVATLTTGQYADFTPLTTSTWAASRGVTGVGGTGTAALVGIADAGTYLAATTVEAALQELAANENVIDLPITSFVTNAGVQLTTFADNTSASAPGFTLLSSGPLAIRWNNNNNSTGISTVCKIPSAGGLSAGGYGLVLHLLVSKTGATSADATTFGASAIPLSTGALYDASSSIGGTTSAMTGNATAKTIQHITLTLDTSNAVTAPGAISVTLTPTQSLINTDDLILHRAYITQTVTG